MPLQHSGEAAAFERLGRSSLITDTSALWRDHSGGSASGPLHLFLSWQRPSRFQLAFLWWAWLCLAKSNPKRLVMNINITLDQLQQAQLFSRAELVQKVLSLGWVFFSALGRVQRSISAWSGAAGPRAVTELFPARATAQDERSSGGSRLAIHLHLCRFGAAGTEAARDGTGAIGGGSPSGVRTGDLSTREQVPFNSRRARRILQTLQIKSRCKERKCLWKELRTGRAILNRGMQRLFLRRADFLFQIAQGCSHPPPLLLGLDVRSSYARLLLFSLGLGTRMRRADLRRTK